MGRKRISGYVVDEHGNAVGGDSRIIRVYELNADDEDTNTLADLFLARTGVDEITNDGTAFFPYSGQQTTIRVEPVVADTLIQVVSTTNFRAGDVIVFRSGATNVQRTIKAITDADTLELTEQISFAFPVGSTVGGEGGTGYWQAWVEDDKNYAWTVENDATGEEGERQVLYVRVPTAKDGPTGGMVAWGTDTPPTDWLLCYGQAVSRATYADLFDVIATDFGVGDGATTFNLPDTRGRVLVGQDDMGGSAANRLTAANAIAVVGGASTHTLVTGEIPSHSHAHTHSHTHGTHEHNLMAAGYVANGVPKVHLDLTAVNTNANADNNPGATETTNQAGTVTATTPTADATAASAHAAGGGGAHNIVQPYITVNWIIRT